MDEINKSEDIIKVLFEYVEEHFNDFGHTNWHTSDFGGSWSPFVETCFMLEAMKYGNHYKIGHCYTQSNITDYIEKVHRSEFGRMYSPNENPPDKYPCRCFDVSWIEQDNSFFLALEHSEDSPSEIKRIQRELKYSKDEDVKGVMAINQLLAIRDEINKLKDFKANFKVIISRPHPFDGVKRNNNYEPGTYGDSVNYFKKIIENDLKKDAASFDDTETWVIILITPDPNRSRMSGRNNNIKFYCYEWKGKNEVESLSDAGEKSIEIQKENGKWVKVPTEIEQT